MMMSSIRTPNQNNNTNNNLFPPSTYHQTLNFDQNEETEEARTQKFNET